MTDPIIAAARFLEAHLPWLAHRPEVGEALADVAAAARVVSSVANQRQPGRYAGPCNNVLADGTTCGEDVEARPGSDVGICKSCDAKYNVDEQQEWMRGEIEDSLARPIEIAGMLAYLGMNVSYRRVMKFVEKRQLVEHGTDEQQRPLYRVGDVLEIVARNEAPRHAGGQGLPHANLGM